MDFGSQSFLASSQSLILEVRVPLFSA
jgi:hypothetical protein